MKRILNNEHFIKKRITIISLIVCIVIGLSFAVYRVGKIYILYKALHTHHCEEVDKTEEFDGFTDYCHTNGLSDSYVDSLCINSERVSLFLYGVSSLKESNELVSLLLDYIEENPQCVIHNNGQLDVIISSGTRIIEYTIDLDCDDIVIRIPPNMLHDELGDAFERNVSKVITYPSSDGDIDINSLYEVYPNAEIEVISSYQN